MSKENKLIEVLKASQEPGIKVEFRWRHESSGWLEIVRPPQWNFETLSYRVLRRKRGGTRRITAKDWEGQPVVWVRMTPDSKSDFLVTQIHDVGYTYSGYHATISWKEPNHHANPEAWSLDRKTWHPFEVEEGEGEWEVIASTEDAQ